MHILFPTSASFAPETDEQHACVKHLDKKRNMALAWMRKKGLDVLQDRKIEKMPSLLLKQAN